VQGRDGGPRPWQRAVCGRAVIDSGGDACQEVAGEPSDPCGTPWVRTALAPAALTLSLAATARLEPARQARDPRWHQRGERAARPERLIAPAHRLVARQRAKDWEDTRAAQRQLHEADERCVHTPSRVLAHVERAAIAQRAQHRPALWDAPTTTGADRTERMRPSMPRVMVQGEGVRARLHSTMEWVGGGVTAGITTRPVRRTATLSASPLRCERLKALAAEGDRTVTRTAWLAQEGGRAPRHDRALPRQTVVEVRRRRGRRHPGWQPRPRRGPHAWRLSAREREGARTNAPWPQWRQRGGLKARWQAPEPCGVVWADAAAWERLKALWARSAGEGTHTRWLDAQAAPRTEASRVSPVSSVSEESELAARLQKTWSG